MGKRQKRKIILIYTVKRIQGALCSVQCAACSVQYAVCSRQCEAIEVLSIQFAVFRVPCLVFSV